MENIFSSIKTALKKIGPFFSMFFGVIFIISSALSILGLAIALGVLIFNINSPYIISDIPLHIFTSSIYYYIGLISIFLIAAIPLIFLLILGTAMISRKNTFRPISSGILVAIWMIAIVCASISATDLAPRIYTEVEQINKATIETREYNYKDFHKLYLAGHFDANITPGNDFNISLTGRQQDLDKITFNTEEGQLQIMQTKRDTKGKICLFCFDKEIQAEITMPKIDSFVGISNSHSEISGFKEDIYVSLGESSIANIDLQGQNLTCKLAGVSSKLELTGEVTDLDCQLIGRTRLIINNLKADNIKLDQDVLSKSTLSGKTNNLTANLDGPSKLYAYKMEVDNALIKALSHAKAEVYVTGTLEAYAEAHGHITYRGNPLEAIKETHQAGLIKPSDNQNYETEFNTD